MAKSRHGHKLVGKLHGSSMGKHRSAKGPSPYRMEEAGKYTPGARAKTGAGGTNIPLRGVRPAGK